MSAAKLANIALDQVTNAVAMYCTKDDFDSYIALTGHPSEYQVVGRCLGARYIDGKADFTIAEVHTVTERSDSKYIASSAGATLPAAHHSHKGADPVPIRLHEVGPASH